MKPQLFNHCMTGKDRKRKAGFFLTLMAFLFFPGPNVNAQSSEEMMMLSMFYEEKDLVITPTRYPKPINQVAENITVVYSDEIEAMNAHTVADVLRWIPGLIINTSQDFGATSLPTVQGSSERHVTVLLDGIRWNYLSGGNAETVTIPVGIIDRIEVIKGPASSAWGSSLGGVVNIITKQATGKNSKGQVYASYGEADSLDARAEAAGGGKNFGYYLYAGKQESDGLLDNRAIDNVSLFSKIDVALSEDTGLNFNFGYSEPENNLGSAPDNDIRSDKDGETLYANAALNVDLPPRTMLSISGYYISQDTNLIYSALGLGIIGQAGDLFQDYGYREKTYGASANVVWEPDRHTVVTGMEMSRGDLEQSIRMGDLLQMAGFPALSESHPDVFSWAVYVNDSLSLDRWAVTPGIRLDHNTVSGYFFSPSLGVTFQPVNDLLFRGTVSRGFHYPPLSFTDGGGFLLDPNPDLEAEEVWSYQIGVETTALPGIRVKTTLFLHDLDQTLDRERYAGGPPTYNDLMINSGGIQRQGVEVDLKTGPFHNLSLEASGVYVHFDQLNSDETTNSSVYNLILSYDHPEIFAARLSGHFEDLDSSYDYQSNYDDIIWDLNVSKTFALAGNAVVQVFAAARNLFDGDQYSQSQTQNPGCWLEGGIRFAF